MSVEKLPVQNHLRPAPQPIVRPCEWGLKGAINDLETQLGSIEAYNMLTCYANYLKRKIDAGNAKEQNPLYATNID